MSLDPPRAAFPAARETGRIPSPVVSQPGGSATTRSDAFAVVVAKLGDLCDTALGTYDTEQTNRSSSFSGERGTRHKRRPWRYGGNARPCALPLRLGSGALTEVCYSAFVKTSRSCDTASQARNVVRGTKNQAQRGRDHTLRRLCGRRNQTRL